LQLTSKISLKLDSNSSLLLEYGRHAHLVKASNLSLFHDILKA